jgi:nucleotide-binding universal stress UspA family protein
MRVLLAVDDSAFSEAATKAVINQLQAKKWQVCALHCFYPLAADMSLVADQSVTEKLQQAEKARRAEAEKLLARTKQTLQKAGFKVRTLLGHGEARQAIITQAARWKPDLIVVGSHGRKGLDRLLIGSVAEYVARHANCSVQIVRPSGRK